MNEKLFGNPGAKIKKVAVIFFWITFISGIICAFGFGFEQEYYYYRTHYDFNATIFFSILLSTSIGGYLSSLMMYGVGELIEKATKSTALLNEINNKIPVDQEKEKSKKIEEALKF